MPQAAAAATATDAASQAPGVAEGDVLEGRYRVEKRLGEGAMGAVFLVEHVHMRKRFALKVLLPEAVASPEVVARFEREAIAAGNIDHPNVAKATDFGRLPDGSFFLVLEYVAGRSVREVLEAEGALPQPRAVAIVGQVLSALAAAHQKGVVHRDIKPENVMLGSDGVAKVLDFGIAKVTEDLAPASEANAQAPLTRMGAMYGTPAYMSPEQVRGEAIDARSDLYAVGVLLYEALAGRPPFDGEALEVVMHHLYDEPAPLVAPPGAPPLEPSLVAIAHRLLQKDRDARFATAQDAIAALSIVEAGFTPAPAPVAAPTRRAWLPIAVGGGALAVVLMFALVVATSDDEPEPPPKKPAKAAVMPDPSRPAEAASTAASAVAAPEPSASATSAAAASSGSGKQKGKKSLVQKIKGLF